MFGCQNVPFEGPTPVVVPQSITDVAVRREQELRELDDLAALLRDRMEGTQYSGDRHDAAALLLETLKHRWTVACGLRRPGNWVV